MYSFGFHAYLQSTIFTTTPRNDGAIAHATYATPGNKASLIYFKVLYACRLNFTFLPPNEKSVANFGNMADTPEIAVKHSI